MRNLEKLVPSASRGNMGGTPERHHETGPLGTRLTMTLQMRTVLCLSKSTTISYMRSYARHPCDSTLVSTCLSQRIYHSSTPPTWRIQGQAHHQTAIRLFVEAYFRPP